MKRWLFRQVGHEITQEAMGSQRAAAPSAARSPARRAVTRLVELGASVAAAVAAADPPERGQSTWLVDSRSRKDSRAAIIVGSTYETMAIHASRLWEDTGDDTVREQH